MFGLGPAELLIIGVFALLFIGPKKLPELARGLGKSLREFQRAKNDLQQEIDLDVDDLKEINDPMMTVEDESFTAHHDELPSNTEVKHGKGKKKKISRDPRNLNSFLALAPH
jgi:TatA/E family protein of Tat protein translocase